ncbi:hypothetical protein ONZ45_g17825 [Pleurotus djamor]|nr:hypothetical protein ONZ45_g17825 [Pleurotus djamor]
MRNQDLTYNYTLFGHDVSELLTTLTWRVDAYVYATNAQPSSDFASQGGAIYVVLVHSGAAATGQVVGGGMEYRYNVSLRYTRTGTSALKQLPPSNTATHSGDSWNYPISFAQDMQMFNNGGNDIFTFPAQYEDSLDLYKGQQTGFVKGQIETQWGVVLDDYPDFYTNFGFGSVSVFTFTDLDEFTFDCKASMHSTSSSDGFEMCSVTRSITVDCTFPSP